jgi:CBS domain-containing membrane protein
MTRREIGLAGLGGGLAVSLIVLSGLAIAARLDGATATGSLPFAVASIAASAVLVFAMPHAPLSQPWPVLGGHVVSALAGVWCALHIDHVAIGAGVAVGAAITLMHVLRCMHPPGGATALSAVLASPLIAEIGYRYVAFPVLSGALSLIVLALIFNYPFAWRRYPADLFLRQQSTATKQPPDHAPEPLSQEDFFAAVQTHGSTVAITPDGLTELLESARRYARETIQPPTAIAPGRFFSNGALGLEWSVREVLQMDMRNDGEPPSLRYRVVAGAAGEPSSVCSENTFRAWARYEVERAGDLWRKRAAP